MKKTKTSRLKLATSTIRCMVDSNLTQVQGGLSHLCKTVLSFCNTTFETRGCISDACTSAGCNMG